MSNHFNCIVTCNWLYNVILVCGAALVIHIIISQFLCEIRRIRALSSSSSSADSLPGSSRSSSKVGPTAISSNAASSSQVRRRTSYFDYTDDDQDDANQNTPRRSRVNGSLTGSQAHVTSVNWRNKAKFYQEEVHRVNMERGKLQDELGTCKLNSDIRVQQLEADLDSARRTIENLTKEQAKFKSLESALDSISMSEAMQEKIEEKVCQYQELVADLESRLEAKKDLERELTDRITSLTKTNRDLQDRVRAYEEEKIMRERQRLAAEEEERLAEEEERERGASIAHSNNSLAARIVAIICPCLGPAHKVKPSVSFQVDSPNHDRLSV